MAVRAEEGDESVVEGWGEGMGDWEEDGAERGLEGEKEGCHFLEVGRQGEIGYEVWRVWNR